MNDLFRPAFYDAYHDIQPLNLKNRASMTADIVGPICESGDFFARNRELPAVESGDFLAIFGVGAYGYSMSSNYNARPRAAELLVEGGQCRVIRERERHFDPVSAERFRFTKMCASGNDFIVVDNFDRRRGDGGSLAKVLCARSRSVGADGLIFVEHGRFSRGESGKKSGGFRMRIFNPDGSEAQMCGNGARCAAVYAHRRGIAGDREMVIETQVGPIQAEITGDEEVKLMMCEPSSIEMGIRLRCGDDEFLINSINTGVPHAVIMTDDLEGADVAGDGRRIRRHQRFMPEGTNVDFVEVADEHSICLRTYERGVEAETLACGTGAVASAAVCHLLGKVSSPVNVETSGGSILKVHFKRGKEGLKDVYLEGDARFVYEGIMELKHREQIK